MKSPLSLLLIANVVFFLEAPPAQKQERAVRQAGTSVEKQGLAKERKQGIERGLIYFSTDDGATWTNHSKGLPKALHLSDMAASEAWLGVTTQEHGLFLYDFRRHVWQPTPTLPETKHKLDALAFYHDSFFVGTQGSGVFLSTDEGQSWKPYNQGLSNLTIRRFTEIDHQLFVGTNEGLYVLDAAKHEWRAVYRTPHLQVNGITALDGEFYIGTNQGAFKSDQHRKQWQPIMADRALHNISTDGHTLYALAYNELFTSDDQGLTWISAQKGLPDGLYTFQVKRSHQAVLAGQWDGVYKRSAVTGWTPSSRGMPLRFPVTELIVHQNLVVASSSSWSPHE
ncbi:hypothetical protein SAMN05421823_107200 [Catalinimonas alkaloidigena]|uniref:Photosynthesis system II assembly factor Ycf48/Hcf136-like domain-containing protein n=1 Tax=Catalinimonas alkaloidigena TaxID=1075417 RepID=A0A1G9LXK0_9BACT|nr:hypothetical protein [Catalinimonas alkaloidigena]SDL66718.1 hypothetical protein SAMN05421823_107200 [Catalinimonas alkaloidigena]